MRRLPLQPTLSQPTLSQPTSTITQTLEVQSKNKYNILKLMYRTKIAPCLIYNQFCIYWQKIADFKNQLVDLDSSVQLNQRTGKTETEEF